MVEKKESDSEVNSLSQEDPRATGELAFMKWDVVVGVKVHCVHLTHGH